MESDINLIFMKLLNKINRRFIFLSIPVMILLTVPVYFMVATIQENEITEGLRAMEGWVSNAIASENEEPDVYPVIEIRKGTAICEPIIKDTMILDPIEQDYELFREMISCRSINGEIYKITVRAYGLEKSNLALLLFLIFLIVFILLNATLIMLNRQISRTVWRPVSETIALIRNFSLKKLEPISLVETDIDEFRSLNIEINRLTGRIISDYQNIKQFSENAAHELQTPLAVIRNKVDTLLSTSGLSEEQLRLAASIEESIDRLNRLNRGLLQLSKIENQQYDQSTEINLSETIGNVLEEFREFFDLKSIQIEFQPDPDAIIEMDPELARILFNNLLNNAAKYTPSDGKVIITVNREEVRFSNSGRSPLIGGNKVFNRFYRENIAGNSTGLGLALVKSICNSCSADIRYEFSYKFHHFILELPHL